MNRFQRRRAHRRARQRAAVQHTHRQAKSRAALWLRFLARLLRAFR